MAKRGRTVAVSAGAVALAVLVPAVFRARELIGFEYHAWRLSTGDANRKVEAARELLERNPGRATVVICREIGEIYDSDRNCANSLAATVSGSRTDLFPEGHFPLDADWIMSHVSLCDGFMPDAQHSAARALVKIRERQHAARR